MEFNLEEIKKLREDIEALRRDVAQLHGRLDVVESLLPENGNEDKEAD